MVYIIFMVIVVIIGGYFAFQYLSIRYALKQIEKEATDIGQDLTQNQILHLPIPNLHLKKLLSSFNMILEEIQKERQKYETREKEFQRQIENISHDLRTPLTVILGYLKLMKRSEDGQVKGDSELAETIDIIQSKAEVMKELVTQFYDFSRLNAGEYQLSLSKADVCRILKESIMGNYEILQQAHLQVETEIPDYPIWVWGEETELERIFMNLFQNAGRYGDTCLCVYISQTNPNVTISFINDTQMLSEEDVPHLFDRFYMKNNLRNQGGTGLGLTVAKSLAEAMGAELSAHILTKELLDAETVQLQLCFQLSMPVLS